MQRIKEFKLRMRHVEQISRGTRMLCIVLTALVFLYVTAGVFYREFMELQGNVLSLKSQTTAPPPPQLTPTPDGNTRGRDPNRLPGRVLASSKIFGEIQEPDLAPTPKVKPTPQKSTDDTLSLIGTFVSTQGTSYAIVENKKKRQQDVFMIGDNLFDIARVEEIDSLSITIDKEGKVEKLVMEEGEATAGSSLPPGVEAETKVVDSADVEDALNNLPVLLTQARTVPYFSNGRRDGLRLFAIRSGSFFEKIGLKNGDILKEINGSDLNDQSKALELFQKLKSERRLAVKLVRNRKEMLINYEIR